MEKVKIFGIGLPKTAGSSFSLFLHESGLKTIHDPSTIMWHYYKGNLSASQDLKECEAMVGMMGLIYKELYDLYPNAKYVLTTRNKDNWLVSCKKHFRSKSHKPIAKRIRQDFFECLVYDESKFEKAYDIYHSEIMSFFKDKDNLLVLDISKDKVGKAKDFLGLENDISSFPHVQFHHLPSVLRGV